MGGVRKRQGQSLLVDRRTPVTSLEVTGCPVAPRLFTAARRVPSLCLTYFEPAPTWGSVPHHHILGNCRWRGQTSFNVSPSYNRPFLLTYPTGFGLWISPAGFPPAPSDSPNFPASA